MTFFTYSFVFDLLKAEMQSKGCWKGFLKLLPNEAPRQRSLQISDMVKILGENHA